MISYVSRLLSTPSWWIPASWAKAFCPTIALFGCTGYPLRRETRRLVRAISSVSIPVRRPSYASARVRSAMTISSSAALPARSPIPLIAHSTWRAPASIAASELAMANPRSL